MRDEIRMRAARALVVLGAAGCLLGAQAAPPEHNPSELIGTWKGTSTCSDLAAAPACHDEVVIYDFTAGTKPGSVNWKADKVVAGERQTMGEFELTYDPGEACWAAEYHNPRTAIVWCLVVDGSHLTGTGRQLPGEKTVRKIDARRQAGASDGGAAIKGAVEGYYAAYRGLDKARYRACLTDDYVLLENGALLDADGDLAVMAAPGSGYRRTDAFEFRVVKTEGDVGYAVYVLTSDIKDEKGARHRVWLESMILRRSSTGWRTALLHSTRVSG